MRAKYAVFWQFAREYGTPRTARWRELDSNCRYRLLDDEMAYEVALGFESNSLRQPVLDILHSPKNRAETLVWFIVASLRGAMPLC